jgi:hypothetical protein
VASVRRTALAVLISMVERWKEAGTPSGTVPLGGFEEWADSVGGILKVNGYGCWREKEMEWRKNANPRGEDLKAFIELWAEIYSDRRTSPTDLFQLAESNNLFADLMQSKTTQGRQISFGKNVLSRNVDVPVGKYKISRNNDVSHRLYFLIDVE